MAVGAIFFQHPLGQYKMKSVDAHICVEASFQSADAFRTPKHWNICQNRRLAEGARRCKSQSSLKFSSEHYGRRQEQRQIAGSNSFPSLKNFSIQKASNGVVEIVLLSHRIE